jgi:mRNA-degrading endonuclease toxin of MazEF toxin-antitoxin module
MENPVIRQIPRNIIQAALKDEGLVRLFEALMYGVGSSLPANTDTAQVAADAAQSTADDARARAWLTLQPAIARAVGSRVLQAAAPTSLRRQAVFQPPLEAEAEDPYPSGIGYTAATSVSATQLVSKSTAVNINSLHGSITMFADALAANTVVAFTLSNSSIEAGDIVQVAVSDPVTPLAYNTWSEKSLTGSVVIALRNITAGALSDAVVLNFYVFKLSL